jgi:hypothetical protein
MTGFAARISQSVPVCTLQYGFLPATFESDYFVLSLNVFIPVLRCHNSHFLQIGLHMTYLLARSAVNNCLFNCRRKIWQTQSSCLGLIIFPGLGWMLRNDL